MPAIEKIESVKDTYRALISAGISQAAEPSDILSAILLERVVKSKGAKREDGASCAGVSVTRDVFWMATPAERMAASSTYTSEVGRRYRKAARLLSTGNSPAARADRGLSYEICRGRLRSPTRPPSGANPSDWAHHDQKKC